MLMLMREWRYRKEMESLVPLETSMRDGKNHHHHELPDLAEQREPREYCNLAS